MSRSRYDREAAFFDGLRAFDQQHRVLSIISAWLISVTAATILMVGPLVGSFAYDWLFGFDPDDGGQIAVAWFGGSAVVGTVFMLLMGGSRRVSAVPEEEKL